MSIKYSCFISYCHGQALLMRGFIEKLKEALDSSIEPYLDEEVCIDQERLAPGFNYNEALAEAICESVCMIAVFVPKYGRHSYFLRELEAMARIEEKRFLKMGDSAPRGHGLIIPIILRGDMDCLPEPVRAHRHCCDFSRFTTASPSICEHPEFIDKIDQIARYIHELYETFTANHGFTDQNCKAFELPMEEEIARWQPQVAMEQDMPFREEDR